MRSASDTEFCLSIALGNKLDMNSLTFFTSKYIYFMLKRLCLKGYAERAQPTVCF